MEHLPVRRHNSVQRWKFLVGLFSGLCFGMILIAFTFLESAFFKLDLPTGIMYFLLFYLLTPLLLSLYVARHRRVGDAWEGQQVGLLASFISIFLTLLVVGIFLCALTLGHSGPYFIPPGGIFIYIVVLNIVGFLVSVPGSFIGGKLGEALGKR